MRLDQMNTVVQQECHLDASSPILVGVSGGPDSLCLADALHRLGYSVVIAHFHHQLRPEAAAEAEQVRTFTRERGLRFELGSQDAAAYSRQEGFSIEEAARKLRYPFLFAVARQYQAQAVATGHTADDQVETVLMHLLRGAGLSGLKGMQFKAVLPEWDDQIPLVRPLLGIWREETLSYCQEHGLQPVFDPSNQDSTYFRNRLRNELLPILETYNPGVRAVLQRMSRSLAGDYEIVQAALENAWTACAGQLEGGCVSYDLGKVQQQPVGLQRAMLRQAVGMLRPDMRDIDFHAIEHGAEYIRTNPGGQCDLAAGLYLETEGSRLYLAQWDVGLPRSAWPQLIDPSAVQLMAGEQLDLDKGWTLCCQKAAWTGEGPRVDTSPLEAWLDAESLQLPLTVRGRKPGDRFQPFGLGGHSVMLSDYFVNVKLAQRARDRWPLVCSAEAIAWVGGYRVGDPFQVKAGTHQAIHLQLIHGQA